MTPTDNINITSGDIFQSTSPYTGDDERAPITSECPYGFQSTSPYTGDDLQQYEKGTP